MGSHQETSKVHGQFCSQGNPSSLFPLEVSTKKVEANDTYLGTGCSQKPSLSGSNHFARLWP